MGGGPISGTYTLENNSTEINFEPDSCVFPVPFLVRIEVLTSMLFSNAGATTSAATSFLTRISPVFVSAPGDSFISVVEFSLPTNPVESATPPLQFPAGFFSTCASDGLLYLSARDNFLDGRIVEFNTNSPPFQTGLIALLSAFGGDIEVAGMVLSPDERRIYAMGTEFTESNRPFLSVIDRAARLEITRIQLNSTGRMRNVALSRDGTRVYAANLDAHVIHVVDTSSLSEVDTDGVSGNAITPHPTSFSPSGLAVSLDDSTLFVSHERGQTVDISVFNTTTFVEGVPIVSNAAKIPMIAITINNSIRVNPPSELGNFLFKLFNFFTPFITSLLISILVFLAFISGYCKRNAIQRQFLV